MLVHLTKLNQDIATPSSSAVKPKKNIYFGLSANLVTLVNGYNLFLDLDKSG